MNSAPTAQEESWGYRIYEEFGKGAEGILKRLDETGQKNH